MSKPLAAIITDTKVVFIANSQQFSVPSTDENFASIIEAIEQGDGTKAIELANLTERLKVQSGGKATIVDGRVLYDGRPVHNSIQERIENLFKRGIAYDRLLRFLEKVMLNPSPRAQQEIFPFMENKGIPINAEGNLIAYKVVTRKADGNLWDKYTGSSYRNNPGDQPFMERELTDDWGIDCGQGFHVGNLGYSGPNGDYYAGPNSSDVIVLVEVNPKHIVSVPRESSSWSKFRCNTYKVLSVYNGKTGLDDDVFGEIKQPQPKVKPEEVINKLKKSMPKVKLSAGFKPGSWKDIVYRAIKGKPTKLQTVYDRVQTSHSGKYLNRSLSDNQKAKVRQVLSQIAVKNDKGIWRLNPESTRTHKK